MGPRFGCLQSHIERINDLELPRKLVINVYRVMFNALTLQFSVRIIRNSQTMLIMRLIRRDAVELTPYNKTTKSLDFHVVLAITGYVPD